MSQPKVPVFVIYYRELPVIVSDFIAMNKKLSSTKDGAKPIDGHHAPRLTVFKEPEPDHIEDPVLEKLYKILDELYSNNQIVAYRYLKKN